MLSDVISSVRIYSVSYYGKYKVKDGLNITNYLFLLKTHRLACETSRLLATPLQIDTVMKALLIGFVNEKIPHWLLNKDFI